MGSLHVFHRVFTSNNQGGCVTTDGEAHVIFSVMKLNFKSKFSPTDLGVNNVVTLSGGSYMSLSTYSFHEAFL